LYWKEKITDKLNEINPDLIVDLLPLSYKKMIDFKKIKSQIIIPELTKKDEKVNHQIKKIKGEFIKGICENGGIG
jgi:cytoplasmic iron level regulating protein YaaA (DUF328/UPF0246 family)